MEVTQYMFSEWTMNEWNVKCYVRSEMKVKTEGMTESIWDLYTELVMFELYIKEWVEELQWAGQEGSTEHSR